LIDYSLVPILTIFWIKRVWASIRVEDQKAENRR